MNEALQAFEQQNRYLDDLKTLKSRFAQTLYPVLSATLSEFEALNEAMANGGPYESFAPLWQALLAGGEGEEGLSVASDKIDGVLTQMRLLKEALEDFERLRPGVLGIEAAGGSLTEA